MSAILVTNGARAGGLEFAAVGDGHDLVGAAAVGARGLHLPHNVHAACRMRGRQRDKEMERQRDSETVCKFMRRRIVGDL